MSANQSLTFWTIDPHLLIMGEPERAISRLGLPGDFVDFLEHEWGIKNLHPPQAEAMIPVLAGKNTMVCIPTASGKSLVAFMGIVHQIKVKDVGFGFFL